jgi:leucyl/phenylalanyl-tRNA--protein transferase
LKILSDKIEFPYVEEASKDGLLAIGGDLNPERLILAYKSGIFPWFEEGQPFLWWSPDPRFVLFPDRLKVSKSMKQVFRKTNLRVTRNKAFDRVIDACSVEKRPGQTGTWITTDMKKAYIELHRLGYAISVEVWDENELVGGLYGVDIGNNIFCGESMFAKVSNASKIGFVTFIQESNYKLIDCQVFTEHLESLGAEYISRNEFINIISH